MKIKDEIRNCLEHVKLELSQEKTLLTHSGQGKARFLNYHIRTMWSNTEIRNGGNGKGRRLNGNISLTIPADVVSTYESKVKKNGKVLHMKKWVDNSDYDIITAYELQMQGLINYYEMAHDVVVKMGKLRYTYGESLVKTLALKYNDAFTHITRTYRKKMEDGRMVIATEVQRKDKKPLVAIYGKKPITQRRNVIIHDEIVSLHVGRNELVGRLLNNVCEICGSSDNVQGHHIRKLADLRKYEGKERPEWVKQMAAKRRKTLFVCKRHHEEIHQGKYDEAKIT